jgi:hypothetical protein
VLGEILARGLVRLIARKSSPNKAFSGDSSLDFTRQPSGHHDRIDGGKSRHG